MKSKALLLIGASIFACGIIFSQVSQPIVISRVGENPEPPTRTCAVMDHENALQLQNPSRITDRQAYEQGIQNYIAANQNNMNTQTVITIPVVVHVIWKTSVQNINDQQVLSQITVLNQDFGRTNPDAANTPAAWTAVAANTTIQFCMAQRTPSGTATTGIERFNTSVTAFTTNDNMKHASSGGLDAWDPTRYLNIWVCNMSGGILGYGEFPTGSVSQTFGVVIQYNAFGSQNIYPAGTYFPTYNLGRTTTHEFSHCFNLFHIWGDDNGACSGSDLCADTPNQGDATFGSPTYPVTTDPCSPGSPGIQFMNYMDYSDDAVMNMFTNNQKTRMLAVLNTAPYNALQTSNGCQAPASAPPSAVFTMSATTVCRGTPVNFTDISSGTPTSWTWTFPSGTPVSATTQNVTGVIWNTAGTYTVTHTATNSNGTGTTTQVITVNALPVITTTTTGATICSGSSTTITAAGGTTYSWMPGSLSGTTVTVSPATTTTYTITGTNANGCTATATRTITVNPSPTVTTTTTGATICSGNSTTITASGATTYVWMPGSLSGTTVTVSPATTTTYTVTGTGASGCTSTATRTITVNPTPTVTTTTTGGTICSGSSTTISASGATSYSWMPGSLSGTTVTVSPATTTTYTVTGTSTGCSGTATRTITVNPTPTVTTTTTGATICSGNNTTITASGATTYTWMPGSLSGTTVTVSPTTTTTYTVTGTSGACTATATRTITVNPTPTVTTTTTGGTICSGSSTTISASGATSYSWMPGSLSGTTVTVSPATTTTYTVTGTGASGCTSTATRTITVNPTPTVTTTTTGGTICSGSSTTISASGATTYAWMPGSLSGTTVTVSPVTTTTYTVTGTSGACTATATRTITVNPSPTVTASSSSNSICTGNSVTLTASGATTYTWMPGSLSGASITTTPAATTTYTVTGTSTGCSGTTTVTVMVGAPPTVTASASSASICNGNNTTLTGSGATTYTWMPGNLSGTTVTVSPTSTTTYTVTGTNAPGCFNSGTVTVTVNALPSITTTTTGGTICSGNSTTITASGASTYVWMPGNLSGTTVTVSPATTTTYTVTGTNATGCSGTTTVAIVVNALPAVTASIDNATVCTGTTVTLTGNGALTYSWSPISISGSPVTDIPASSMTYSVTGTDANGCTNTAQISVTVNAQPAITVSGNNLICPGTSTTLTASGASAYVWQPGGQITTSITDSPSATTTYSVTGTDVNGCSNNTTYVVTVDAPPSTPSITVNGSLLASTVTGASYQWFLNGTPIAGATSQSYTVTQSGNYTVEVYDAAGCGSGQSSGVSDPLGIDAVSMINFIRVIPNPNDGHFVLTFNVSKTDNYVLEIQDVLGQIIYSETLNNFTGNFSKEIDLGIYGRGMYTIRLKNSTQETVVKSITY